MEEVDVVGEVEGTIRTSVEEGLLNSRQQPSLVMMSQMEMCTIEVRVLFSPHARAKCNMC